ncbi:hypothetical protein [Nocardia sp. XZ_19_385]|uniref:hypothetical protein n=1 Tax=Nocardia sp. XZ_19_385 TaxID=2769488 RepID=UPI00188E544E|nr:hypothetical protein [Nocardia sp. XZ_19_385]
MAPPTGPTPAAAATPPTHLKALWVLVCALSAVVVALVAGIILVCLGTPVHSAICIGGGAFAGTLGLGLGILNTLWPKNGNDGG